MLGWKLGETPVVVEAFIELSRRVLQTGGRTAAGAAATVLEVKGRHDFSHVNTACCGYSGEDVRGVKNVDN